MKVDIQDGNEENHVQENFYFNFYVEKKSFHHESEWPTGKKLSIQLVLPNILVLWRSNRSGEWP